MTRKPASDATLGALRDFGSQDSGGATDEELAKTQLASRIRAIVRRRQLTQTAAALTMGIDQPKVSALLNGRLANFSSDRLMRLLTALGQDVEIVIRTKPSTRARGRIRVVEAHV